MGVDIISVSWNFTIKLANEMRSSGDSNGCRHMWRYAYRSDSFTFDEQKRNLHANGKTYTQRQTCIYHSTHVLLINTNNDMATPQKKKRKKLGEHINILAHKIQIDHRQIHRYKSKSQILYDVISINEVMHVWFEFISVNNSERRILWCVWHWKWNISRIACTHLRMSANVCHCWLV